MKEIQNRDDSRKRTVYVVYGRDHIACETIHTHLKAFNLHLLEKDDVVAKLTKETSPFVGDILTAAFEEAQAIIVLLTGEDRVRLREQFWESHDARYEKEFWPQSGQDQIFEAGYAFGISPDRTILVQIGHVRPFSDIAGRYMLHFGNPGDEKADRRALWRRLEKAGCILPPLDS
ncbi:MAG TPA: TIR domain-containing protein [Ktedonobacteraceae bacterium]|nr:TIR domain-containing protein [Ktedonobacteraceae bacterium]